MIEDSAWWDAEPGRGHEKLFAVERDIRSRQSQRYSNLRRLRAAYNDSGLVTYTDESSVFRCKARVNIVRSVVNTACSRVASKTRPAVSFVPEGGSSSLRLRAKGMTNFVAGVWEEAKAYKETMRAFRSCAIYGNGFVTAAAVDDRVEVSSVSPFDIAIDSGEAQYGRPSTIYHRRFVDRLRLREVYGIESGTEEEQSIYRALSTKRSYRDEDRSHGYDLQADQVLVVEAFREATTREGTGAYLMAIEGCDLQSSEWSEPHPFASIAWVEPEEGFWSVGLAEEILLIQEEISELLAEISKGHHLITGHWLVEGMSQVATDQINNDLSSIIRYQGTRPDYQVPQIIAPEVYNHLNWLVAKAYEVPGISQMQAGGLKPAGLNSGEAQRAYNDQATERMLEISQAYEQLHCSLAEITVRAGRRCEGLSTRWLGYDGLASVKLSDVDIEDDQFRVRTLAASMLPDTLAGKLSWVEDMSRVGNVDPADLINELDVPDLENFKRRTLASRRVIERMISDVVERGYYRVPEPTLDQKLGLRLTLQAINEAELDNLEKDSPGRIEMLRRMAVVYSNQIAKEAPPEPAAPPQGEMP
jgi:hypothetical protein